MLQKDVEAELKDNAAEQERLLGTSLVYGDSIQVRFVIPIPSLPHPFTLSPLTSPQLQHTLTKKYVRVNTTLTSRTENTSLRVELSVENSNGCIFKILPRYKVRSVGDVVSSFTGSSSPKHYTCMLQVRYNDQVKFESVKTEGQFLHCSVRLCGAVGFHVLEYKSVH